jgi:TolB-like protein
MKKALLFLTALAILPTCAFSADSNTVKVVETKGQGVSRDEAINMALKQAIAQVKGVKVSSIDTDFAYRSASADIEKTNSGKKVDFDAVAVNTGGTTLRTNMLGQIKTYEVLGEKKIDDKTYEVTLKVSVYDYESPDKTNRLKLAVMPIRTLAPYYQFGNITNPSFDTSRLFSQKLAVALTQTNKFAVLDREYVQEFARERNIMLSEDASVEETAKLGQVLGVDYMLVGIITRAGIAKREVFSPIIGRPISEYEADFSFEYRLIVGPTRQIKLADVFNIKLKTDDIKRLVSEWKPQDMDYKEMSDNFIAVAANGVVETIIDNLYPTRIASVEKDGRVIINQGGARISEGQLWDVFSQGKEIFDVDTKESLGSTEVPVATIMIDRVMPKISYAKVVKGDLSKITEGLICRPRQVEVVPDEGRKSNIQRAPTGGVKLPFDNP